MKYYIDYIVLCETGKVRIKNQDNFWCGGKFLESENNGLGEPVAGKSEETGGSGGLAIYAVFDGMGGEKHGETAAYLAAKTFDADIKNKAGDKDAGDFLYESCLKMNDEICLFSKTNRSGHMGTTAAILAFGEETVFICNIGDSRIFKYAKGSLAQLTVDHVMELGNGRKAGLTQHLGIPKTEFIIEPYIATRKYFAGERYLICSDGLTDMVRPDEIKAILEKHRSAPECAAALMNAALSNGGVDNTTVILCDIYKNKKRGFSLGRGFFGNIFKKGGK